MVAIYDYHKTVAGEGQFYFLRPGDSFDMKSREARRSAISPGPFHVLTEDPWPVR